MLRVAGVERVHVRQQQQRVGLDQRGDQRGQPVVVAEPDLVGGDGVVLVDDRYRAEVEQPAQRPVRVAVVHPPGDVVDGQQHLPDGEPVAGERLRVRLHQQSLADARRGLLGGQVARPLAEPQRCQTGGDGAGGDEHDLAGLRAIARERVDQRRRTRAGPARRRLWSATTSRS